MVPGMNHCQGGAGTDTFDKMAAIEAWVATGKRAGADRRVAPDQRHGRQDAAALPVPQVAKYQGAGDTNDAANFTCANP